MQGSLPDDHLLIERLQVVSARARAKRQTPRKSFNSPHFPSKSWRVGAMDESIIDRSAEDVRSIGRDGHGAMDI
jgi:hypothetical protein